VAVVALGVVVVVASTASEGGTTGQSTHVGFPSPGDTAIEGDLGPHAIAEIVTSETSPAPIEPPVSDRVTVEFPEPEPETVVRSSGAGASGSGGSGSAGSGKGGLSKDGGIASEEWHDAPLRMTSVSAGGRWVNGPDVTGRLEMNVTAIYEGKGTVTVTLKIDGVGTYTLASNKPVSSAGIPIYWKNIDGVEPQETFRYTATATGSDGVTKTASGTIKGAKPPSFGFDTSD
jgi:hypothetical protein